ncbi:transmembrane protein 79-like [Huso huso]|uniref:Transmembrane protein 79-like n=1 Tax=Huso huso TaxID=61971 RepID=A0ABR0Y4E1_HUSHU
MFCELPNKPSTPETMTSAAHLPASRQELKEFDSVKESISDIINQLQDIDPARLSFSPFLDLDTQISLAPVSDSPESSVEELNSLSCSSLGSRTSLEPPPGGAREEGPGTECTLGRRHSNSNQSECSETSVAEEEGLVVVTVMSETSFLDAVKTDGHRDGSVPQSQGGIPNGTEENHPQALNRFELTNQEATRDEEQPFLGPPPHAETIELASHGSQGQPEDRPSLVTPEASDRGRCVCCGCCRSARLRAVSSVFASLLLLPAVLYGLYFYLPFDPPLCPDLTSRITFTIRCCVASAAPIILGVLTAAVSRLCSPALHPLEACPRGPALQQRFVSTSVEQLLLYALNLVVMATFLEQEQLRAVPTLAGVFGAGRLLYWLSLHLCSSLRGFSSGLTFFPLLAMAAFNLFCLFELGLSHLFPIPQGEASSHTTPAPGLAILGG